MHLEVFITAATDGDSAALVKAMRDDGGAAALESAPGCHSVKVYPGIEHPGNVIMLIEWDSAEVHKAARTSQGFLRFYEIAGPFIDRESASMMQHFDLS